MTASYVEGVDGITDDMLEGFFVGWHHKPSPARHLAVLRGSTHVITALDEGKVVGFITAVSDGVLAAFIPLVEVLPAHQGKGIGQELVRRMLQLLGSLYSVDLVCDEELVPFYAALGGTRLAGMGWRSPAKV